MISRRPLVCIMTCTGRIKWLTHGHEWLGASVRRVFDGEGTNGKVVKWARAAGDDPPIWHMCHEDGDEEDLEEEEAPATGSNPAHSASRRLHNIAFVPSS